MSRWVVRGVGSLEITVVADWLDLDHGVLSFYRDEEQSEEVPVGTPVYDGKLAKWTRRTETVTETVSTLVRAFGVGQWRDVEPLAEPPEEPMILYHANGSNHPDTEPCSERCGMVVYE